MLLLKRDGNADMAQVASKQQREMQNIDHRWCQLSLITIHRKVNIIFIIISCSLISSNLITIHRIVNIILIIIHSHQSALRSKSIRLRFALVPRLGPLVHTNHLDYYYRCCTKKYNNIDSIFLLFVDNLFTLITLGRGSKTKCHFKFPFFLEPFPKVDEKLWRFWRQWCWWLLNLTSWKVKLTLTPSGFRPMGRLVGSI